MPLDSDTDKFLKQIKFRPARDELRRWAEANHIVLVPEDWSGSGFTSAILLGVTIVEPDKQPRSAVLKIEPHARRSTTSEQEAHRAALRDSKQFAKDHMVDLPYHVRPLPGGGQIMFQAVAGNGFGELIRASEIDTSHDAPESTYRRIVKSLLTEWNKEVAPASGRPSQVPAGTILANLLGSRIDPGGTIHAWAAPHQGLLDGSRRWLHNHDQPLVNPFALARDEAFARDVVMLDSPGKVHGDLHPGNLLVGRTGTEPINYCLVDLARYQPGWPLPWDPAYLMLTKAANELVTVEHINRARLREVLLHPAAIPTDHRLPPALIRAIKGIHQGEVKYFSPLGQAQNWRKLRLVCVAAIGLILSGRDVIARADHREWFFWLSAFAATELLSGKVPIGEPLPLPRTLIPPSANPTLSSRPTEQEEEVTSGRSKADRPRRILGREDDQRGLRSRLSVGTGGIVIVHGQPGVGKSTLVDSVLADLDQSGLRIRRREAIPDIPFDVRTLTDAATGDPAPDAERSTKSSIAQLEAALGDEPVVIVVECAENLLHRDTGQVADLDLDEAFQLMTTASHRVTLVLVTSRLPRSPHGTWPDEAVSVEVRGLTYDHFVDFLETRDEVLHSGLSELPPDLLRRFHQALRGNPCDAELVHAVLAVNDSAGDAATLAEQISDAPASAAPRLLAKILLDGLSPVRRRVLDTLAAFAIPVGADALVAVLAEEFTEPLIRSGLRHLANRRVVRQTSEQFYLPASELGEILNEQLVSGHSSLLLRAAIELSKRRALSVHGLGNLRIHFAELSGLLRYGWFATAYKTIESIDRFLQDWNCGHLLLEQRETVKGRMRDSHSEMANDNRLGHLYSLNGRFEDASDAYGRALKVAEQRGDEASRRKLRANLASMYMCRNETRLAHGYYDLALEDKLGRDQPEVVMGTLEGLADCCRRWGRFDEALAHAEQALNVHRQIKIGASDRNTVVSRAFRCTLKLARWHAELGLHELTASNLETARQAAVQRPDLWLAGAYLDARAEFELSRGKTVPAARTATEAVDYALRIADPVTLMQARTTLAMAYLTDDDLDTAAAEVTRAVRYRHKGRALIVLALQALTERLRNNTRVAEDCFQCLYAETTKRIAVDGDDFTAWDLQGFALCGLDPTDAGVLDQAVIAFQTARNLTTSPTPLLVDRLKFMLTRLGEGTHPGLLRPAIDACGTWSRRAERPD